MNIKISQIIAEIFLYITTLPKVGIIKFSISPLPILKKYNILHKNNAEVQ